MALLLSTEIPLASLKELLEDTPSYYEKKQKRKKLITELFLLMSFVIYKKASSFVLSSQKGHL